MWSLEHSQCVYQYQPIYLTINILTALGTLSRPVQITPHARWILSIFLPSFRDGLLVVAQWLDEAGFLRRSSAGWDNAAEGGHLHVLKVIIQPLRAPVSRASRGKVELVCFAIVRMQGNTNLITPVCP